MNVDPMALFIVVLGIGYTVFVSIVISIVVRMRVRRQHSIELNESRSNPDTVELAFEDPIPSRRGAAGSKIIAEVLPVRRTVLAIAVLLGVLMYAVTSSPAEAPYWSHEMIERVGIIGIMVCILGRTWASLYVARPDTEHFATAGPYSVMRNPLHFFSIVGAAGAGAQIGSIVAGVVFGVVAWALFYVLSLREERLLGKRYSEAFADYMVKVPRFLPDPRLWRNGPTLTIKPPEIRRMLAQATLLLLAAPVAEAFERLQNSGVLPVLFRLP